MAKSKKIIFRVKPQMFEFLGEFAQAVRMEKSELMRRMIEHYFLLYFNNKQVSTYEELKCQFLEMNKSPSGLPVGLEQKIVSEGEE